MALLPLLSLTLAGPFGPAGPPNSMTQIQESEASSQLTVAEKSGWLRTSTHAEVLSFVRGLEPLPHAERLAIHPIGTTEEGRELVCVMVADPLPADLNALRTDERLRILVNANIHAGEVEGKEAVQMILRELARGEHAELLEKAVLLFVPIYNADGNDRIDPANRVSQNGPDEGVGTRANAKGLDLNRDFVKVESAECRALLSLIRRTDPHVFMDLHTTNGSYHGYHLTYSPSLSTNVDPAIDEFARGTLLPQIRKATLDDHGYRVFDYGNFSRDEPRTWATYDHRPRFGTNYYGLRNRFSILSEAYSHLDFEARVRVTRSFVLECLEAASEHAQRITTACSDADQRASTGLDDRPFGFSSELAPAAEGVVLVGGTEKIELPGDLGTRLVATDEHTEELMLIQDHFLSTEFIQLPEAWLIPDPEDAEIEALQLHGVQLARLDEPLTVAVRAFVPVEIRKSRREFQGHHEIALVGEWIDEERELPAGTLVVSARQPLSRLAAQLLEPESEDSLSTWNAFEERTRETAEGVAGHYPVLRVEPSSKGWNSDERATTPVPPTDH